MRIRQILFMALAAIILQCLIAPSSRAEVGDTLWVQTWQQDFINWATAHEETFEFPDESTSWSKVVLRYTIECPGAPNDCDPWDRLGYLQIVNDTGEVDKGGEPILERIEIGRIITPYDITGGARPGSCVWEIDVSDYMHLLHGEVLLRNYIESWIGGDNGWLVTLDFGFIEGAPAYRPFKVINLWDQYRIVYGDPSRPIEDSLVPLDIDVDVDTDFAKLRLIVTGHGQGNTGNCAEFCPKSHSIFANGDSWQKTIWKSDCNANPCSPQGGTWQFARAGWCPGQDVLPWDTDITASIVPGETVSLDYDITPYTNHCCPCNPACVSGTTCADCEYNFNGHTEPHYSIQSQLILFEEVAVASVPTAGSDVGLDLGNEPNPFRPGTTIHFELPRDGIVELTIFDSSGRRVRTLIQENRTAGPNQAAWDGTDGYGNELPGGVYYYALRSGQEESSRSMILLR